MEIQLNLADRTISVLLNENIRNVLAVSFRIIIIFSVNKRNDIGVLLDGA